ncbi:MAG: hypothetical protein DME85_11680 [Verrucomicrobia bacterium]|nr:MAG: hypothetical protein DME85_11680 [Verrucomicrobiota bacterium]
MHRGANPRVSAGSIQHARRGYKRKITQFEGLLAASATGYWVLPGVSKNSGPVAIATPMIRNLPYPRTFSRTLALDN